MATLDPTVRQFANRVETTDDPETPLEELWNEYTHRYPNGVERELFRWHLEQAGVETAATADGVVVRGRYTVV